MLDAEGFDQALLAQGEANEKTELDQFGNFAHSASSAMSEVQAIALV